MGHQHTTTTKMAYHPKRVSKTECLKKIIKIIEDDAPESDDDSDMYEYLSSGPEKIKKFSRDFALVLL
jgi:hypothetical protein